MIVGMERDPLEVSGGGRGPGSDPGAEEIAGLLLRIAGRIRDELDRRAAELELSPRQAMALLHLERPIPMRELAGHMRCDASNVTGLADRLEGRGLIVRAAGHGDRRVKHLVLTDEGRAVRDRLRTFLFAGDTILQGLDDPERRMLGELLSRMLREA
jgi:DNA-binding MarR family transcriptional regulator